MQDQNAERWRELCAQAAIEQDPVKRRHQEARKQSAA